MRSPYIEWLYALACYWDLSPSPYLEVFGQAECAVPFSLRRGAMQCSAMHHQQRSRCNAEAPFTSLHRLKPLHTLGSSDVAVYGTCSGICVQQGQIAGCGTGRAW